MSALCWEPQAVLRRMAQLKVPGMREIDDKTVVASVGRRALICFNAFRWANMAISVSADNPNWINPQVLNEISRYVFVDNDCRRLEAQTEVENRRCRRLLKGLGFKQEGILRNASYNQNDMVLFSLLKEECAFLKDRAA